MPNGQPYYQRTANRQKFYAFHERRKKRALVVYAFHASQYAEQRTSDPQSPPVDGGGTVIHVDFTQKKGA